MEGDECVVSDGRLEGTLSLEFGPYLQICAIEWLEQS